MLKFTKMNGAGNDFVVVDNRDNAIQLSKAQIENVCDRHRGVGADGFLAVEPSEKGSDYRMRYYNADGGEAEMCGNGARCFGRYANRLQGGNAQKISFETIAGVIEATFEAENVRIQLSEPFDLQLNTEIELGGKLTKVHSVNTGVPHAVVIVDDIANVDIVPQGGAVRHHEHFAPAGTNANFMMQLSSDSIAIRTYERGVENETLACGTGMVANAIIHNQLTNAQPPINVRVAGGDILLVDFERDGDQYKNVTLTGPADFVFEGEIEI
ncbi:MAG: diaminopimelate epimerase [Verrucomicrobiales bacterium]|jgi:diaminopimelate epimerase